MRRSLKQTTIVGLALALLFFVVLAAVLVWQPAQAQEEPQGPAQPESNFIQVQGQARVAVEPDQATVRLGVVTQAPEAADALQENRELVQEVISATIELEIPEEQIQTEVLRLSPVQQQEQPVEPQPATEAQQGAPEITAFEARNVVSVTVDDLDMLGDLLDAAVTAGANVIEGINFEVTDQQALLAEARQQAIADARNAAETYVEPLDAQLGNVLVVRSFGTPGIAFEAAAQDTVARGGAGFPVQPGRQFIEATVEVSWEIVTANAAETGE